MEIKSMVMRSPSKMQSFVEPIPPPTPLPHLSCRRRAGTVLSITGQDLGTLGDESVTDSLHRATQNSPVCCVGRRQQSWSASYHMHLPTSHLPRSAEL